ncbi:hypothetical protein RFI_37143, partial [Reticulomyxa filosa]
FLVVSSATNVIFNLSKDVTNRQIYSNYYNNIIIFAILLNNYYIDNVQASKRWKCLHCAQIYKLTILSDMHIFNNRSMVLENESIRFPTSKLLINTKMSKKHVCIKMPSVNISQSILVISSTFCKLAFKSLSYRLVIYSRNSNEEKGAYMIDLTFKKFLKNKTKQNSIVFADSEVEAVTRTPSNKKYD